MINAKSPPLPDFAIVGAARAGTTSLWSWLGQHPELHLSPVKETNFFSRPELGTTGPCDSLLDTPPVVLEDGSIQVSHFARVTSWDTYRHCLTPLKPGVRRCGEASVSYAFYPEAASRLHQANPACQVIFVLRHPVTRVLSNYRLFRQIGAEPLDLAQALREESSRIQQGYQFCWAYAALSSYRACLSNYLRHFPKEQIFLARFEDLIEACDVDAWCGLLNFLGVDPEFEPNRHHLHDTKELQVELELDPGAVAELERQLAPEIEFYKELFASQERRSRAIEVLSARGLGFAPTGNRSDHSSSEA
jgi:hypothetical protein